MKHKYTLTKQITHINEPIPVKQVSITNPTSFPVYVKYGGQDPSIDRYDFYVQPKSDGVSLPMHSNSITVFITGVDQKSALATVEVSDVADKQPSSLIRSIESIGSSNYSGYPYTILAATPNTYVLPALNQDIFRHFVFTFSSPSPLGPIVLYAGPDIRVVQQNGGAVSVYPRKIPDTITPSIDYYGSVAGGNPDITINVFTHDVATPDLQVPSFEPVSLANNGQKSFFAPVTPGIVYYHLVVNPTASFALSANWTVSLIVSNPSLNYQIDMEQGVYGPDAASANDRTLILPRYTVVSDYGLFQIRVMNTSGAGNFFAAEPSIKVPL